eukprot:scaffold93708_cov72-Phaeocystis_antarctica.AAC.2
MHVEAARTQGRYCLLQIAIERHQPRDENNGHAIRGPPPGQLPEREEHTAQHLERALEHERQASRAAHAPRLERREPSGATSSEGGKVGDEREQNVSAKMSLAGQRAVRRRPPAKCNPQFNVCADRLAGLSVRVAVYHRRHDHFKPEAGERRVVGERGEPLADEEQLHGEASRRVGEELVPLGDGGSGAQQQLGARRLALHVALQEGRPEGRLGVRGDATLEQLLDGQCALEAERDVQQPAGRPLPVHAVVAAQLRVRQLHVGGLEQQLRQLETNLSEDGRHKLAPLSFGELDLQLRALLQKRRCELQGKLQGAPRVVLQRGYDGLVDLRVLQHEHVARSGAERAVAGLVLAQRLLGLQHSLHAALQLGKLVGARLVEGAAHVDQQRQ